MHRSALFVLCVALTAAASTHVKAQTLSCGIGHLVTIAPDGSTASGSKDRLRQMAASGMPIRVGFGIDANADGTHDVVHWADAGFVTIFENEIFAQLADIQRQAPMSGRAHVQLPAGRQRWSGLIGTDGKLESHFDDGSAPVTAPMGSTWCVDPRAAACAPQWRLVYRHDADGKALEGSLDALLAAVRRGADVRVAWGFAGATPNGRVAVEHAAEPVFLTITNEAHVFVQIPEHIGQQTYHTPEGARFDKAGVMWRGLFGTNGTFDAIWTDRATGAEVRRMPQRAGLAWFAEIPGPECQAQAPLTLATPNGVRQQ